MAPREQPSAQDAAAPRDAARRAEEESGSDAERGERMEDLARLLTGDRVRLRLLKRIRLLLRRMGG